MACPDSQNFATFAAFFSNAPRTDGLSGSFATLLPGRSDALSATDDARAVQASQALLIFAHRYNFFRHVRC
jgi:hypothetical protein